MKSKAEKANIKLNADTLSGILSEISDLIEKLEIEVYDYSKVTYDDVCIEKFNTSKGKVVARTIIHKNQNGSYGMMFNGRKGVVKFNNRPEQVDLIDDVEFTDVTSGLRDLYYNEHICEEEIEEDNYD